MSRIVLSAMVLLHLRNSRIRIFPPRNTHCHSYRCWSPLRPSASSYCSSLYEENWRSPDEERPCSPSSVEEECDALEEQQDLDDLQ